MFLWRSPWAIGRRAAAVKLEAGPRPPGWAHHPRRKPLLSFLYPGPGRKRLGLGLAWWSPARVRRREAAPGPELACTGCSRRYGAGRPAAKREDAEPSSGVREEGEERAAVASGCPDLYENPWTIPNLLCMARIGLSPYLGYLIVEEEFNLALGLFTLAGITDLLDGYIARNWANQKSALGSALDPLADKILISVLYVSLTCAELIPAPLTAMVLIRDITLIAAGFYIRYRTVPPPRTLSKYFNPCYATAQLKPTFISKVNTAVQLVLVAASLAAPVFQYVDSVFLHSLWYITALTTAASAYSYYLHGKNTVQVLKRMK
ncbi:cardiolipin synthase (CMP-forming) [Rhincodon typus]|uniref:cardiolipin synthase (CMP-forming) n=1 Tax=Rhincodon typus TaxID=259920 RepID=UPI00202DFE74|nr:cardiolipin synthase (CMP-forming) [Rhincodon typus]